MLSVKAALEELEYRGITLVVRHGVPHFREPSHMPYAEFKAVVDGIRKKLSPEARRQLLEELQHHDPGTLPDHACPPWELRRRQFDRVQALRATLGGHPVLVYSPYTRLTGVLRADATRFPPDVARAGVQGVPLFGVRWLGDTPEPCGLVVFRWVTLAGHTFPDAWKTAKGWAVTESFAAHLPPGCVPPADYVDRWAAKREREKKQAWYRRHWGTEATWRESLPPD